MTLTMNSIIIIKSKQKNLLIASCNNLVDLQVGKKKMLICNTNASHFTFNAEFTRNI